MHHRIGVLTHQYENISNLILSFPRCGRTWMKHLLGHYIAKKYKVEFSKWVDRPRPGIPRILFRHDWMSTTGHLPWDEYFAIQEKCEFIFKEQMKKQNIIYLFREPLDVLFSYWPYLKSIPYKNFAPPAHDNIIDFAHDKQWGFDIIINFMNAQIDHYHQHQGKKLFLRYEDLKKDDLPWQRLIEFIFGTYADSWDKEAFLYAKEQTTFSKMQEKNKADTPDELKFYRRGGSNYIHELSKDQQDILLNWTGYKDLNRRINES